MFKILTALLLSLSLQANAATKLTLNCEAEQDEQTKYTLTLQENGNFVTLSTDDNVKPLQLWAEDLADLMSGNLESVNGITASEKGTGASAEFKIYGRDFEGKAFLSVTIDGTKRSSDEKVTLKVAHCYVNKNADKPFNPF